VSGAYLKFGLVKPLALKVLPRGGIRIIRSSYYRYVLYPSLAGLSAEHRRFLISEHWIHRPEAFGTVGVRQMSMASRNADRNF
jgi:hypothetical protein